MKLHLGCGDRYMFGYVNIDQHIPGYTVLAKDYPDEARRNRATLDRYYPVVFTRDDMRNAASKHKTGNPIRKCVVDVSYPHASIVTLKDTLQRAADAGDIPHYKDDPVTDVVMVQVLEHLSMDDGLECLRACYELMAPYGIIHLDLPDFESGVKELFARQELGLLDTDNDEFLYRHFFGSQKNKGAFHLNGFSYRRAEQYLLNAGFTNPENVTTNYDRPRCYPYFIVEAYKHAG